MTSVFSVSPLFRSPRLVEQGQSFLAILIDPTMLTYSSFSSLDQLNASTTLLPRLPLLLLSPTKRLTLQRPPSTGRISTTLTMLRVLPGRAQSGRSQLEWVLLSSLRRVERIDRAPAHIALLLHSSVPPSSVSFSADVPPVHRRLRLGHDFDAVGCDEASSSRRRDTGVWPRLELEINRGIALLHGVPSSGSVDCLRVGSVFYMHLCEQGDGKRVKKRHRKLTSFVSSLAVSLDSSSSEQLTSPSSLKISSQSSLFFFSTSTSS